jgi:hypothetical protein
MATGNATIEELWEEVFPVWPVLRLYNWSPFELPVRKYKRLKLGNGQAYDHSSD